MKRLVIASVAFGLVCASGASIAQHQSQTSNLQDVTVTAAGQYETYVVNLKAGYGLEVRVGNTHRQYVQAQRSAARSETLRMQGMAPSPMVAVAADNSSGPGLARQIQLLDNMQNTLAIVNVYCKHAVKTGKRCLLVPTLDSTDAYGPSLASVATESSSLAQVK
jgi:hypothetical protein